MSNSNSLSLACKTGDLSMIASALKDIDCSKSILSGVLLTVVSSVDIPNQFKVLDLLWEAGARIEERDGNSILHIAAKACAKEAIKWIHKKKIVETVDLKNSLGMTPFDLLIRNAKNDSYAADTANLLIQHGAKFDTYKPFDEKRPTLVTSLYYAACAGNAKLVELLIKHNANVNAETRSARENEDDHWDNIMPIHVAVRGNSLECVDLLLKNGSDINKHCIYGTPLVQAKYVGNREIIKSILIASLKQPNYAEKFMDIADSNFNDVLIPILKNTLQKKVSDIKALNISGIIVEDSNNLDPLFKYLGLNHFHPNQMKYVVEKSIDFLKMCDYLCERRNRPDYKKAITIFGHGFTFGYSKDEKMNSVIPMFNALLKGSTVSDQFRSEHRALDNGELASYTRLLR